MLWKWLPWKLIARHVAKAHGFLDPVRILARIEKIAQPSEVAAPIELIRAGIRFHARGLINTKVIQQNLDWVWPFWVQRQFDPSDESFVPRAFSATHINLTHRNWTAVGLPGCNAMPIVDPRGLVTPLFDHWSLDACFVGDDGVRLVPAQTTECTQDVDLSEGGWAVTTETSCDGVRLHARADVTDAEDPKARSQWTVHSDRPGWLIVSLRPFNPEGVGMVESIALDDGRRGWSIDGGEAHLSFSEPVDRHTVSTYGHGDVLRDPTAMQEADHVKCKVGLATAAAMFRVEGGERTIVTHVDLSSDQQSTPLLPTGSAQTWAKSVQPAAKLQLPDEQLQRLYEIAIHSLVLLSPDDAVPGPYTYKRFWFRDAALMAGAMLGVGLLRRGHHVIDRFLERQRVSGYFHSQEGEWDSNGQVLWVLGRAAELTGRPVGERWVKPLHRAAAWIQRKRVSDAAGKLHQGLMPAGFSAEHLGNNDFYYWDNFWSVAGLRSAADIAGQWGHTEQADTYRRQADEYMDTIEHSLGASRHIRATAAIPASPYRRMDAGAVGSLAAGYPLHLLDARDERLVGTAEYLHENSCVDGAFFQQMIHSGLNAYLTLHLAQVFLRAGDARWWSLLQAVVNLASPTGQWPEAIHPRTGGGCMGDGHHGWAGAELALMIRSLFLREEGDTLVLAAGIRREWIQSGRPIEMGPIPTRWGPVTVRVERRGAEEAAVHWDADWRGAPPVIRVDLPAAKVGEMPDASTGSVTVPLERTGELQESDV
ncbi:MAG: hypothetical protein ACLFVH_05880 [Phycisphaerae bacterium]